MRPLTGVLFAGALVGCSEIEGPRPDSTVFDYGVVAGTLRGGDMREVSGLVASLRHPGHFWLHNDSGNPAELILIDSTGLEQARLAVQGLRNRDWEDIARRGDTLYIAETGDNDAQYDTVFVYAVLEPTAIADGPVDVLAAYPMQYPDGRRDAESLMVDHLTGDWFLVSKREERGRVYRYAAPQRGGVLTTLERLPLELPFRLATAADMAPSGREFVIKTYGSIYLWQRSETESVAVALQRAPAEQPYVPERQGEAIAYTLSGSAYYTASEMAGNDPQRLIRYRRRP